MRKTTYEGDDIKYRRDLYEDVRQMKKDNTGPAHGSIYKVGTYTYKDNEYEDKVNSLLKEMNEQDRVKQLVEKAEREETDMIDIADSLKESTSIENIELNELLCEINGSIQQKVTDLFDEQKRINKIMQNGSNQNKVNRMIQSHDGEER